MQLVTRGGSECVAAALLLYTQYVAHAQTVRHGIALAGMSCLVWVAAVAYQSQGKALITAEHSSSAVVVYVCVCRCGHFFRHSQPLC